MTINVKVGYAKTHLSDLMRKVEDGEDVVISRGEQPVVRLVAVAPRPDVAAVIAEIRAARAGRRPTTAAEIREWIREGRRYE